MCSSPKLFAAYHVLHRLIVPRHPSCALSSLTTKKTFAPGTLPHSGLSLLLFLSTKKLFLFLQILFQDTFFDCQSTPRSPAALPLLPQRKSFLIKSVCRTGGFVGESFSPHPHFHSVPGFHFPWVAPFPSAAAALPPYLSAFGGQLLTTPCGAAPEGLRCAAFTFVTFVPRCPLRRPPNRAVRSHPLRGAYRAFLPGDKAERTIINIWWAYLDLNQGPRPYQGRALTN